MRRMLEDSNLDLVRQSRLLIDLIDQALSAPLLAPYRQRVRDLCAQMAADAQRNLDDLKHDLPSTFEAILSNTQAVASYLDIVGSRFTGPILRGRVDDDVMLAVLQWLHSTHAMTKSHPFAFGDGGFSVYHDLKFPTIYFLPASRQLTLLYVPLFFHEYGHVLYRFHKPEMDDLVKEFQQVVSAHAAPATIRERGTGGQDDDFRAKLVLAWYPWAQEFFCDAIGLTIGGAAYLQAFSHYLRLRSKEQYYRPRKAQLESRHPVTLLRVRMLADRARKLGLTSLADSVESAWISCAKLMRITEDYEGTWSDDFLVPLRKTLDDMIEEANPVTSEMLRPTVAASPVHLCNAAWEEFERSQANYAAWETQMVGQIRRNIASGDPWVTAATSG